MCVVVLEQLSCIDCYCNDQIVIRIRTQMRFVDSSRDIVRSNNCNYRRAEKDCNGMALGLLVELCECGVLQNSMAANFRGVASQASSSKSAILIGFRVLESMWCPVLAIKRRG